MLEKSLKIIFYVPPSHLDAVKNALFEAGAGRLGNYDACAWQVLGEGQFRPLSGSRPFLGEQNQIETVEEYRVEVLCKQADLTKCIEALKTAHPYETPAYEIYQLFNEV